MSDPQARPADEPSTPPTTGGRTRRRAVRIAAGTLAGLLLAAGGLSLWFYHRLDGNLHVFDSGGLAGTRPPAGPLDPSGNSPVNVLLLGSDSRADGNDQLAGGQVDSKGNSDTAILLHVAGDHRHAVGVSIPRDSLVDIPPCRLPDGRWTAPQHDQMFNSAFGVGGAPSGNPACSQNTVEALTGLRVDHTIVVDFKGFAAMTSAVGGVPVCVPANVDSYGIHLRQGRQVLSGEQALSYVRARHGIGDSSDIGRMKRQQAFMSALFTKVRAQGFDLPTLLPLADAATRSLTVDRDLGSPTKLATFAGSLSDLKPADVLFVTTPWRYVGDRVALVHPDVDQLWALLREDHPLDARPATAPPSPAAGPGGPPPSTLPTALPTTITRNTRPADTDPCADLSYG
ncbi:LCP family protein [Kitasatospora sp. NPDC052896]|uniref:LCP family protein n=1 Tax=Kitasatospora sp. NPDC052896 TaxID=3364061 RepID=UPI0037C766DA